MRWPHLTLLAVPSVNLTILQLLTAHSVCSVPQTARAARQAQNAQLARAGSQSAQMQASASLVACRIAMFVNQIHSIARAVLLGMV
jgi:hypothetical protein